MTGARWPCDSHAHGKARAVDLGLKEYEITEDGMDPPTIRETAAAMR